VFGAALTRWYPTILLKSQPQATGLMMVRYSGPPCWQGAFAHRRIAMQTVSRCLVMQVKSCGLEWISYTNAWARREGSGHAAVNIMFASNGDDGLALPSHRYELQLSNMSHMF
jgi:hypothetical protein